MVDLTGKVVIITGASKGIGEAMARGMAAFGETVIVSSRKQAAVDAVVEQFQSEGLSANDFPKFDFSNLNILFSPWGSLQKVTQLCLN